MVSLFTLVIVITKQSIKECLLFILSCMSCTFSTNLGKCSWKKWFFVTTFSTFAMEITIDILHCITFCDEDDTRSEGYTL